ncbi:hypothetical protein HDU93_003161, partial [Gonapodya sp. JEL0774]
MSNRVQINPTDNFCGPMQGSSLSLEIFNFFINELMALLLELQGTGIMVHGVQITTPFIKVDRALVVRLGEALMQQVGVLEEWYELLTYQ